MYANRYILDKQLLFALLTDKLNENLPMNDVSTNVKSLLHTAGSDLFAARIVLCNLNNGLTNPTTDAEQKDQIEKIRLLLDQTAETLSKITDVLNQESVL